MTPDDLLKIMPLAKPRIAAFFSPLCAAMEEFEINTPARQAAFLAQIGHESDQLLYVREIASGKAYEGRADLGNTEPGDGVKYKGRGLIQITGKANYIACMMALNIDCVHRPELLEEPVNACRSAGWFWRTHALNELADAGDQVKVSKAINCGSPNSRTMPNGLANRLALFQLAKEVLA